MAVLVASLVADQFVSGAERMVEASASIISSLTEATNKIQAMESVLIASSGSLSAAQQDLYRIRDITNTLGTSFEGAVIPFAKFAASASQFSKDQIFTMFKDVSTALAGIHAPARTAEGAFLALQQIVSKGKLSMQDLRRQLAEHIPGSMAKAVLAFEDGTHSYEEFEKAVQMGDVVITEFLPKFTALMKASAEGAAARAAKTLNAEMERTATAYLYFRKEITENSKATETWKDVLKALQDEVLNNKDIISSLATILSTFNDGIINVINTGKELIPIIAGIAEKIGWLLEKRSDFGGMLFDIAQGFDSIIKGNGKFDENLKSFVEHFKDFVGLNEDQKQIEEQLKRNEDATKRYNDAVKQAEEERKKAREAEIEAEYKKSLLLEQENKKRIEDVEATYKATGLMAQEYFDNEVDKLYEKAQKWYDTSGDIIATEQWLAESIDALQREINGSVDGTIRKYEDLNAAIQKTVEWNRLAAEEYSKFGVGVSVGGEEARWNGNTWTTENGNDIRAGASTNQQTSNFTLNVSQSQSRSDILNLIAELQRQEARA